MYLLNAPDFLGFESGLEMAARLSRRSQSRPADEEARQPTAGGARRPGDSSDQCGRRRLLSRAPRRDDLQRLIPDFEWCLQAAVETTRWVAGFDFPDFTCDYQLVSLSHDDEYPMNEGHDRHQPRRIDRCRRLRERIRGAASRPLDGACILCELTPQDRRHALPSSAHSLAIALNFDRLSETAPATAEEGRIDGVTSRNPFQGIIARGLELIQAFDEALELPPRVSAVPAADRV